MKKLTSLLLVALMLFSVLLTSCGQTETGFDYQNEDLTPYVTLADYLALKLQVDVGNLAATITEDEVKEYINDLLISKKAYYKTITEAGKACEMGDTVGITYKGVLVETLTLSGYTEKGTNKDGTPLTAEQIKNLKGFSGGEATSTTYLQLGSGSYIDGFEEGLVGKKIGDKGVALTLKFPKDYSNKDLQDKSVVFFVNIVNQLQLVDARELAFKDIIYVTYKAVLDEKDSMYKKDAEDAGLLKEEAATELITLSKDDQFHSALINAFKELAEGERWNKEFTFSDDRNVVIKNVPTDGEGDKTEGEGTTEGDKTEGDKTEETPAPQTEGEGTTEGDKTEGDKTEGDKTEGDSTGSVTNKDVTVTVNYTVTVHKLANVRYWTADEAESGELKFSEFCTKTGISSTTYTDYASYKKEITEGMQLEREVQIGADRRQGAFAALVEKSEVDLSSAKMKELVKAYCDEVKENIDYMTIQVQTDNNLYQQYYLYTLYYGQTSVRNYVLSSYGYKESDLDTTKKNSKLLTDAEEYVTERLVFWQYVKENNIPALTDDEYNKGYEEYKRLMDYDEEDHKDHDHEAGDMLAEMGITEEQLREALFWDKVTEYLATNHCDIHPLPVKDK